MSSTIRWVLRALVLAALVSPFSVPARAGEPARAHVGCWMVDTYNPKRGEGCRFLRVDGPTMRVDVAERETSDSRRVGDVEFQVQVWPAADDAVRGRITVRNHRTGFAPGFVMGRINRERVNALQLNGFVVGEATLEAQRGCVFDHYVHVYCQLRNPGDPPVDGRD